MIKSWLLPRLIYFVYRILSLTWRTRVIVHEDTSRALNEGSVVFAHWHGHELAVIQLVSKYKIATMTSTSKDGSLVDYVVRKMGGATSRGSSTRGGSSALKGLVRLLRSGKYNASVAVDGPKGPIYKVKPGIFELSRLGECEIIPVGAAASSKKIFERSWNKALLPLPFSKVVIVFGSPFTKVDKSMNPKDQRLAEKLEQRIAESARQALNYI